MALGRGQMARKGNRLDDNPFVDYDFQPVEGHGSFTAASAMMRSKICEPKAFPGVQDLSNSFTAECNMLLKGVDYPFANETIHSTLRESESRRKILVQRIQEANQTIQSLTERILAKDATGHHQDLENRKLSRRVEALKEDLSNALGERTQRYFQRDEELRKRTMLIERVNSLQKDVVQMSSAQEKLQRSENEKLNKSAQENELLQERNNKLREEVENCQRTCRLKQMAVIKLENDLTRLHSQIEERESLRDEEKALLENQLEEVHRELSASRQTKEEERLWGTREKERLQSDLASSLQSAEELGKELEDLRRNYEKSKQEKIKATKRAEELTEVSITSDTFEYKARHY